MQVEIIQNGIVLRTYGHKGQNFVEAPPRGEYSIRLTNTTFLRKLAVVSVDGVNILNGEDASHKGQGFILGGMETIEIPGFKRDNEKVAAFTFSEQEKSYAALTGRGTSNVGVIGVAIFNEKTLNTNNYTPYGYTPRGPRAYDYDMEINTSNSVLRNDSGRMRSTTVKSVGTAYGAETAFHTQAVFFQRATESPAQVIALRYATRECLESWGVPVDPLMPPVPNPFPASNPSVPEPPGYNPQRGSRDV